MKYTIFILFIVSQNLWANQIYRNQSGFPTCYQKDNQVYFFEWDETIRTQNKAVFYFTLSEYLKNSNHQISGCEQRHYIKDVPSEILKPIEDLQNELPTELFSAMTQVKQGGRIYRTESNVEEFLENHKRLFQSDAPSQIQNLRNKYGDQFTQDLISTWSKKMFLPETSCDNLIGSCDYYLCAEQKSPCGLDGYNLGFGFKYCSGSKFKLAQEMKTPQGQSWVQNVFQCLQRQSFFKLQSTPQRSCDAIKSDAYDSHPDCYIQAGFCELKLSEKINIFKLIKSEILSTQTLQQGLSILHQCHLSLSETKILNDELQHGGNYEK